MSTVFRKCILKLTALTFVITMVTSSALGADNCLVQILKLTGSKNSVLKLKTGEMVQFKLSKDKPTVYLDHSGKKIIEKLNKNVAHDGIFIGAVEDIKSSRELVIIADENGVIHYIPGENVKFGDNIYEISETALPKPQQGKPSCAANSLYTCLLHHEAIGDINLDKWREHPDGLNLLFRNILENVSFDFNYLRKLSGENVPHQVYQVEKVLNGLKVRFKYSQNIDEISHHLESGNPALISLRVFVKDKKSIPMVVDGKLTERLTPKPASVATEYSDPPELDVFSEAFKEIFKNTPVDQRLQLIRATLKRSYEVAPEDVTEAHSVFAIGIVKEGPKKGYFIIMDTHQGTFAFVPPSQIESSMHRANLLYPRVQRTPNGVGDY